MSRHRLFVVLTIVSTAFAAVSASAQTEILVDFNDIRTQSQYNILGSQLIHGSTLYAIVRGIESDVTEQWETQITKVENIDGTPITTELVSDAEWKALTGGDEWTTILPGNRMMMAGDYLQFIDAATEMIYRVDTNTGDVLEYITTNAIEEATGGEDSNMIDAVAVSTNGEMVFYDQETDNILVAFDSNGVAKVEVFVAAEDIEALYSYGPVNLVAGGMTFDCDGNLYWTLSKTGSTGSAGGCIYKRDAADGTLSQVVSEIDIQLATFNFANVGFNDIYYANDGNIYFYDQGSDGILYFDPDDPVNTLAVYLTEAELINGPAADDFVGSFISRGPYLVWSHFVKYSPDLYQRLLADIPGDFDADGDVDLVDYASFADCLSGPGELPSPTAAGVTADDCLDVFNSDCDDDIDLKDFAFLAEVYGVLAP